MVLHDEHKNPIWPTQIHIFIPTRSTSPRPKAENPLYHYRNLLQPTLKMKCQFVFSILISFLVAMVTSAAIRARDITEISDIAVPEGMHLYELSTANGHPSFEVYDNETMVAALEFDEDTGLYKVINGKGEEISPEELSVLKRDGEIEERGVPFLIAALIGAALRIVVKRFGQRVVVSKSFRLLYNRKISNSAVGLGLLHWLPLCYSLRRQGTYTATPQTFSVTYLTVIVCQLLRLRHPAMEVRCGYPLHA